MSRTLTLELSDEAYSALRLQADAIGTSPERLAAVSMERQYGTDPMRTEAEEHAARERFNRQIGAVDLGHATGADNESIDADLAIEYADDHERA